VPSDLQTAMSLTRAYERRIATAKTGTKSTASVASKTTTSSAASSATTASTPRPRFRRLSPEELAAKRANNKCYYYPEKFTNDHRCKAKGVFLLELDDDVESEVVERDLGISLHALTGINVANTMKLQVTIVGKLLLALVDTESTHTFVKEDVVTNLALPRTSRQGLSVKVANGERVASGGVCLGTDLDIAGECFTINLYVLPLNGFDIVLGV
jgi:hypothetical protein